MAMIACRECGKPISTTAPACPHCGHVTKTEKVGCARVFLVGFAAVVCVAVVVNLASETTPSSVRSAADEQRFTEEVGALLYLRSNMNNPASFNLVSFTRTNAGALCITYRGTNSYNAITMQRHTIAGSTNSASAADWARHCQDQPGKDVSGAKYALP